MTTGCATIIRADARALPLRDSSVDLVVTSPPYFGLRSYQDGGEYYAGQLGSEASPVEWLDSLVEVTRECIRVLKPTGSIWVNLGDKYDSGTSSSRVNHGDRMKDGRQQSSWNTGQQRVTVGRPKSLLGLPWRYAIRCVDGLGLTLRAEVIWSKPNGLPESVTDRVRRSHEQWFHFVTQPRYFASLDVIREAHSGNAHSSGNGASRRWVRSGDGKRHRALDTDPSEYNLLGKLPSSVWEIPTQPLTVPPELDADHFAAFPVEWPRRIILGWSPAGICTACNCGREPTHHAQRHLNGEAVTGPLFGADGKFRTATGRAHAEQTLRVPTGTKCACPEPTAPTRPAVVLDPFGGTGTTALAAKALRRHGISVDMSADYCRIAEWRTNDPGELAKALGVARPPAEVDGQTDLLDALVAGTNSRGGMI